MSTPTQTERYRELRNTTTLPTELFNTLCTDGDKLNPRASIFGKFLTGELDPPYAIETVGDYAFMLNRKDNDEHWESTDPAWVGKASMSQFHRFIVPRTFHDWRLFNILTLPADVCTINMLETMARHARIYSQRECGATHDQAIFPLLPRKLNQSPAYAHY